MSGQQVAGLLLLAATSASAAPAYHGTDVWRDLRADHHGIALAFYGATESAQVARTLKVTQAAKEAYGFADDVIQHIDFARVLNAPLAIKLKDDWRAFNLVAEHAGPGFLIDYRKEPLSTAKIPRFLDWALDFTVRSDRRPLPTEERGFGLGLHGKANTQEFTHHTLARLVGGSLAVVTPSNLALLTPAQSTGDRQAWTEFAATLPKSAALLASYLKVKLGLTPSITSGVTLVHSEVVVKLAALKDKHEAFGEFIETLGDKFALTGRLVFKLPTGLTLAEARIDSTALRAELIAKTMAGKLVPFDEHAAAHPEQAIDLDGLRDLQGTLVAEFSGKVLGLSFVAKSIELATTYHDATVATLTTKLTRIPVPKIAGYALGFVPTWAINLSMPGGTIEECTKELTLGLLQGSRGSGSYGVVSVDTTTHQATRVAFAASTQLIDNFYLNFGLRVVQSYLWPDQDVIADAWRLSQEGAYALEDDLKRLQLLDRGALAH